MSEQEINITPVSNTTIGVIERGELNLFREIDEKLDTGELPKQVGRRVSHRDRDIGWKTIQQHYILGKRKQLEDGIWVSEDYSPRELADKFEVKINTLKSKITQGNWVALRKAYLLRVNQINIGQELGLYAQVNYQSEIAALNFCNKLGIVLDKYMEQNFGDILDNSDNVNSDGSEESEKPIRMSDLKDAINVATEVYKLQRKVFDNAPQDAAEELTRLSSKQRMRSPQERLAKIKQLEAKIGKSLSQLNTLNIEAEEVFG